ncbi:unnamed protein product [marine sediment metagenome]|uniref:Uncharacterized protein n=1 Tax=marine sediment metagenome TaxID=412755 RepID=X0RX09_9ZZZZ
MAEGIEKRARSSFGGHSERKYPVVKGHKYPVVKGHKYPVVKGHKYPVVKGHKYPVVKGHKCPELQGYKRRASPAESRDCSLRLRSPVTTIISRWSR